MLNIVDARSSDCFSCSLLVFITLVPSWNTQRHAKLSLQGQTLLLNSVQLRALGIDLGEGLFID